MDAITKNVQYFKFCIYGFLKNLRFFDAFLILFLIEKGLPYAQIGILYACREIFVNVIEVPSGIIADTFGRKSSLIASFLVYILSFLVFYFSGNFWLFVVAFALFGTADAFRSGTHKGMIMDYLKINSWEDQMINYYGHTRSWSQIGSALSALGAGLIVFYSGSYRSIFLYSVIPYLGNLILIMSYPRELNYTSENSGLINRSGLLITSRSLLKILKSPKILRLINTSASHSAYLRAVKDYIQPLMVNVSLLIPIFLNIEVEKKNGIIIGVIYFFIYLLTSAASKLSSRVAVNSRSNISYITLLAGFIFGIACGIFFFYGLWVASLIVFIGIYVIENVRKPILTGMVADSVPNEILTSVISAQSLLRTILTIILAPVLGIIADRAGIGIAFVLVSLFLTISTVIISAIARGKRVS